MIMACSVVDNDKYRGKPQTRQYYISYDCAIFFLFGIPTFLVRETCDPRYKNPGLLFVRQLFCWKNNRKQSLSTPFVFFFFFMLNFNGEHRVFFIFYRTSRYRRIPILDRNKKKKIRIFRIPNENPITGIPYTYVYRSVEGGLEKPHRDIFYVCPRGPG